MEYYSAIKNNEIMPVAATWIDLEIYHTKLSKSERERQIPCTTYMLNLKHDTNEHKTDFWLPRRLGSGREGLGAGD